MLEVGRLLEPSATAPAATRITRVSGEAIFAAPARRDAALSRAAALPYVSDHRALAARPRGAAAPVAGAGRGGPLAEEAS
ncbi:hypothetical protein [Streptomyces sp. DSM 40750]|uniref:hypothetical protein n=1 Tax=Streptomyces sp. DSM 40750 TaxID=2801030 RepID=UPI003FA7C89F